MNRIFQYVAALCLAAGACSPAEQPPLAGARIGGPFALTAQDGRTVRDSDLKGRWRIVYFGYTYCPDVCPTDMAKLGQALKLLDKQAPGKPARIAPVFITVDPERDTPAVLKAYVDQFDSRFIALTGPLPAIQAVAKSYAVTFSRETTPSGYLVAHSQIAYLMDPDGKPVTSLPLEKDPAAIAAEIDHWVR